MPVQQPAPGSCRPWSQGCGSWIGPSCGHACVFVLRCCAGRFKHLVLRLAILKQCAGVQLADTTDSVVDSLAQLLMLSIVAAGEQQQELQW